MKPMNSKIITTVMGLIVVVVFALYMSEFLSPAPKEPAKQGKRPLNQLKVVSAFKSDSDKHELSQTPLKKGQVDKKSSHNGIAECNEGAHAYEDALWEQETGKAAKIIDSLGSLRTEEGLISHALIKKVSDEPLALFEELKSLNEEYPDNTLLSYDLVSLCTSPGVECDSEIVNTAIDKDGQNGALWLLSSLHELKNNNIEQAKESLLKAARASVFNDYWEEHFSLFEAAFAQSGADESLASQVTALSYIAVAPLPNYAILVDFCEKTELAQAGTLDACIAMGEQLTGTSGTMLSHLIGISLKESAYKKYGDEIQLTQLAQERQSVMDLAELSSKATALAIQRYDRAADWLQQLRDVGEVEASEYVVNEAISLSSTPDFEPCKMDWE